MTDPRDLLTIGRFADMTQLSIKALRLYDQLEILSPCHIDPQSGYRYYKANQLLLARLIRTLRAMEMPLATIRQVLATIDISPPQAAVMVQEYLVMRERQIEQIRNQVSKFTQFLQKETVPMSITVHIKTVPTQQVLSITRRVKVDKLDQTIRNALKQLNDVVTQQDASVTDFSFAFYHGKVSEQEDGPIEICLPIDGQIEPVDGIEFKELAGGQAASVMLVGKQTDFPEILSGYDAAADWIHQNGYEMAESPREVWHTAPGLDAKMEIIWLFK